MSVYEKILRRILSASSDANIEFDDLCKALIRLGFECRIKGSHHIFTRHDIPEILNLQPKGHQAKPYQVKQVRELITQHHLIRDDDSKI